MCELSGEIGGIARQRGHVKMSVTYTNFLQLFDRLEYRDLVCRVRQLGRQRRTQTGQAGADDDEVYTLVCVTLFTHGGVVYAVDLLMMPRLVD
jgi:hypothetical protein